MGSDDLKECAGLAIATNLLANTSQEVLMGQQNQGDQDKQQNNPGKSNNPNQQHERGGGSQSDKGMGQGQGGNKGDQHGSQHQGGSGGQNR